jgi:hypothetical protein
MGSFPNFGLLINHIPEMIPQKIISSWPFWSRQTYWRDIELGHAEHLGATH